MQKTAPYGSWASPITADLIVSGTIRLEQVMFDADDIYWTENRPAEGGRSVVVRRSPSGDVGDVIPSDFNARTRVHEYGGGAFTVHKGVVFFSNYADNKIYSVSPGQTPQPLTQGQHMRYADLIFDTHRNRLICVREDHTVDQPAEVKNTLVAIDVETHREEVLAEGNDFYSSPRLSPDGKQLAWLTWNHPNMPWDGTELFVAHVLPDGSVAGAHQIAGGLKESIFQPEWSPRGELYFVSDRTQWWNLYRFRNGEVEPVVERAAEFGVPQWVFGLSTYDFAGDDTILCLFTEYGSWHLASIDTTTKKLTEIPTPYTYMNGLRASRGMAVLRAASGTDFPAIVCYEQSRNTFTVLRKSRDQNIDAGYLSAARPIEFPTEGEKTAFGFYYAPSNQDFAGPSDEQPPLLVLSHGGPTSATSDVLDLGIQFWTSRGIAVLDVNYGGSTGYGRDYRERLKGEWGVVDVNDCCNGAMHLVNQGLADRRRLAIAGGSAGGYTTLACLTFRDVFAAGASHFGLSELTVFVNDTHKFESRYLEGLIGPYPERLDLYESRSPLISADRLSCPIIFFQGLDDKIVPPNQAELMVDALRRKGIPVAYVTYEGEGHGFRMGKNIKRTLESELYFYSQVFGFSLADPVEPVEIENLA